jgi:hypothetical protein
MKEMLNKTQEVQNWKTKITRKILWGLKVQSRKANGENGECIELSGRR